VATISKTYHPLLFSPFLFFLPFASPPVFNVKVNLDLSSLLDSEDKKSKNKRGVLPKHATNIMRSWLFQHLMVRRRVRVWDGRTRRPVRGGKVVRWQSSVGACEGRMWTVNWLEGEVYREWSIAVFSPEGVTRMLLTKEKVLWQLRCVWQPRVPSFSTRTQQKTRRGRSRDKLISRFYKWTTGKLLYSDGNTAMKSSWTRVDRKTLLSVIVGEACVEWRIYWDLNDCSSPHIAGTVVPSPGLI